MQQTVFKNKFLIVLFSMLFAIASVFVLTACGEEPNNSSNSNNSGNNISNIEVTTDDPHYSNYLLKWTYGEEIDLSNIQFTITAHKFNGETVTYNQNDVVFDTSQLDNAKVNGKVPVGGYSIQVSIPGESMTGSISVSIERAALFIPSFSLSQLTFEYDGNLHNVFEKMDELMPAGSESIASMMQNGKITIDQSYSNEEYKYEERNVCRNSGNVSGYFTYIDATSNYYITNDLNSDQNLSNMLIDWRIVPKVLNLPTYANNGQVQFDWEVENGEVQMKPVTIGLVYGTGDDDVKENMFDVTSGSLTANYFGSHDVSITLKEAYATNFALAGENQWFSTTASIGTWEVTPYIFAASAFNLVTTNAKSTPFHYSDADYPDFAYNPEPWTLDCNLTQKEKLLFQITDGGLGWAGYGAHFANDEADPLYSYTFNLVSSMQNYSTAFRVGSLENALNTSDLTQYYHISRIDAPTAVQAAVAGYTLELESQTYSSESPVSLLENYDMGNNFTSATQEQFSNETWRDYAAAEADYSLLVSRPNQDVSNANETGYTVTLDYYYGQKNYNPIAVSAKLIVHKAKLEISDLYYSFNDNDNGRGPLIYRFNQTIPLTISSAYVSGGDNLVTGNFSAITYKHSATIDGEYSTVASSKNAGFYKATTVIVTPSANYEYTLNNGIIEQERCSWAIAPEANDDTHTRFVLTCSYEIEKRPIFINTTFGGTWGLDYYSPYSFYTDSAKTFTVQITPVLYYFTTNGASYLSMLEGTLSAGELADIVVNTTIVTKQGETVVEGPKNVGDYTTTISYTFPANSNYIFIGEWDEEYTDSPLYYATYKQREMEDRTETRDWSIISTSIDLSGVSWSANTFEWTGLGQAPEIKNLPKGVNLNYGDSYGQYMYGTVGSTQTFAPDSIGSWYVRTRFVVNESVQGYNATTPPTITAYPAGYDTSNNYFEQAYTITTRTLTLGKTDFAAYIYEDSSWVKVGDVNADGTVTATVPFSMESQIIHIMPIDVTMRNYVQTNGTVTVASADAGTSSQTASVITVTPSTNCQFADSITEIQIVVSWTITKKVLPAHIQYWSVYLYVDGGINDVLLLEGLLDYTDNINATGIFGDPVGVPYSGSTQYIYLKGRYSDYVTITYDGSTDKIAVSGEVGNTSDGKVHIVIAPTSNSEFEQNDKDATELTIELGWIIVNAE